MASHGHHGPYPGPDENRAPGLIATEVIILGACTIIVALRLYTRIKIIKHVALDDILITAAWAFLSATVGCQAAAISWGCGRHAYYLTPKQQYYAGEFSNIQVLPMIATSTLARLAVALLLLRVFTVKKAWRLILYTIIGFNCIAGPLALATVLPVCSPVAKTWDDHIPGHCNRAPEVGTSVANGIVSILTDFLLALLPIYFLWNIKITTRTKAGLCVVLGMGVFTGIAAVMRTVTLQQTHKQDYLWYASTTDIWSLIEAGFAIIAGSAPAVAPLFKKRKETSSAQRTRSTMLRRQEKKQPYGTDDTVASDRMYLGRLGSQDYGDEEANVGNTTDQGIKVPKAFTPS